MALVNAPGKFAGNRAANFTSSVEIKKIGGVWKTFGPINTKSGTAEDTLEVSDGLFTRNEELDYYTQVGATALALFRTVDYVSKANGVRRRGVRRRGVGA